MNRLPARRAKRRGGLLLAVVAFFGACSDSATDGSREVAGELRALRLAMQQAAPATPGSGIDRHQIGAALEPLREVMTALGQEQRELQARQLTLTQELQRWSQLLAQTATGAARGESEALTARLQTLEATLKAQDERHRQVEELLGRALDRTADRLDEFLHRLGADAAAPVDGGKAAVPAGTGGEPAPAPGTAERTAPAPKAGEIAPASAGSPRTSRQAQVVWWLLLATAGATVLGVAWRWRRGSTARGGEAPAGGAPAGAGFDRGAEEIWAAAALLGEAVGRLREATDPGGLPNPAPTVVPVPAAAQAAEPEPEPDVAEYAGDDVFVIDEAVEVSEAPAELAPVPQAAAPGRPQILPRMAPPDQLDCHLRAGDPARAMANVLLLLAGDPRVLRRPQPTVALRGDGIDVHFAVLPALPMGERTALEQRLRDAVA